MKNRRERAKLERLNAVNNVEKQVAKPVGKQSAEGSPVYTSGGLKWASPKIDTHLIEQYADNALLAEPVANLKNLIFRGEAQVSVYDPTGETDNDLSAEALKIYRACHLYAAHQIAFTDGIYGGCSVFSPGFGTADGITGTCPIEFRNLPWNSFRQLPAGYYDTYNDIMPGIVYDPDTGEVHVYQTKDDRSTPKEIQNFVIVRDPTGPMPAGKPECLPVVPLITNYNYGQGAMLQKMNRIAAPTAIPLANITAANTDFWEGFVKRWGKDTTFVLPEGTMFADLKLSENNTAEQWLETLKKRIDGYFNPATFIQKDGNSIGGSDSGAMELIYNYIDKVLTTIETQITAATIQKWLDDNGYVGYRAEIKHPRPSVKKDAQILAEVAELAKNGAITINEMRQTLPNTDLGELTPEEEAQLQEQTRARQPQSPFASTGPAQWDVSEPIGNVQSPVQRTDALKDNERELIRSIRQCKSEVMKAVKDQVME